VTHSDNVEEISSSIAMFVDFLMQMFTLPLNLLLEEGGQNPNMELSEFSNHQNSAFRFDPQSNITTILATSIAFLLRNHGAVSQASISASNHID